MKKILIGVLSVLLLVLCIVILTKGIQIGGLKLESIKQIKEKSESLKANLNSSNDLTKKEYPSKIEELTSAIKALDVAKEEYINKTAGMEDAEEIGITQIKTYKVEFLWTTIGNYATKEGATLTMDIKTTENEGVYDLNFTLVGNYIAITDFIYDIENDENLKFEIKNFDMGVNGVSNKTTTSTETTSDSNTTNTDTQNATNETTNTNTTTKNTNKNTTKNSTVASDGKTLKATFTVEKISIELN